MDEALWGSGMEGVGERNRKGIIGLQWGQRHHQLPQVLPMAMAGAPASGQALASVYGNSGPRDLLLPPQVFMGSKEKRDRLLGSPTP